MSADVRLADDYVVECVFVHHCDLIDVFVRDLHFPFGINRESDVTRLRIKAASRGCFFVEGVGTRIELYGLVFSFLRSPGNWCDICRGTGFTA